MTDLSVVPAIPARIAPPLLTVSSELGLAAGDYTLVACPELEDFNGNGLDGNGDGISGDPYSLRFSVAWDNLLPNPNFDVDLGFANWSVNEDDFTEP